MQSKMENFSKAAKEYESGSLTEKIRFLQKYTVFENEVRKHEVTIKEIVKKGQVSAKLLKNTHFCTSNKVARFFSVQHTRTGKNIPFGRIIDKMATKNTNIFN
jgi:hypothetical protein